MPEITLVGENLVRTWGWEIAVYLFLGGLVAGLMVFSGAMRLFRPRSFKRSILVADLASLPLLAFGMLFLLLDLSNQLNVWRLYTTFQVTSIMSWGAWILLVSMLFLAVRFISTVPEPRSASFLGMHFFPPPPKDEEEAEKRAERGPSPIVSAIEWVWTLFSKFARWAGKAGGFLSILGVLLGIGVGFYTGVLLSTIPSRPLWNTAVLAPLFLTSGMASGGAFLCLFIPHEEHKKLAPLSVFFCGVELLLLLALVISLNYSNHAVHDAGSILLTGTFGWVFWGLVLVLGLLVPATIELFEVTERRLKFIPRFLPPVLKLAGSLSLRFVIVFAGLLSFV